MTTMDELKPCPFCGGDDLSVHFDDGFSYYVWCGNCGSQTDNDHLTKKEAIKAWNTRPAEDALKAEVERLKKQVADREDEGYAGFILGVDQMKKKLAEKDKEIERLKSDLGIQKNLTNQACFESNRAYQETEKWKKMFYDLFDKQSNVSTDPKVIVVGKDTDVPAKESEGE